jgi:probable F420-dependent oxidoreductase
MRPFRFLGEAAQVTDAKTFVESARRAESNGYSVLVFPDHLLEILAPLPAMTAAAAATTNLRVGTFVFNNDLRHPAVLAQDLATLDLLSDGRLEIGIGAGWNEPEYRQIGLPFDPVGTRVERLEEALKVLKGMFGDGHFSFSGKHYTIRDRDGQPKPVQKPHPPIMIGGGGRRVLSLAGREADIVSLAPRIGKNVRGDATSITVAATAQKIQWIREAAGDRFPDIELNVYPSMSRAAVTDDARGEIAKLQQRLREREAGDISDDELLASPHIFIGSIDSLTEKFQRLREELGISSFMVGDIDTLAPVVERLAGT